MKKKKEYKSAEAAAFESLDVPEELISDEAESRMLIDQFEREEKNKMYEEEVRKLAKRNKK